MRLSGRLPGITPGPRDSIHSMTDKKTVSTSKARQLAQGNAIDKVCAIFSLLSTGTSLRLSEITHATGMNRVTALRILETLGANGFIHRAGKPPRYSFGPEVVAMTAGASQLGGLREIVRPSLIRLANVSGDVALLAIRSGLESICVDRVAGDYPINVSYMQAGMRRPLGVSAGGMALLAWLPQEEREAIVDHSESSLAAFPRINREVLMAHIRDANDKGYVVMVNVVIDKLGGIARPIYDTRGDLVAAISVIGLTERILEREAELAAALKEEQAVISRRLAGSGVARLSRS